MNKQEFLTRLREGLAGLPQEEISERVTFYHEMIEDRVEDGLAEEEAVAEIGPVEDVIRQIVAETPLPKLVKEKMKPNRRLRAWEIILLILGSPLWLTLLIVGFAVIFSVYVVIWAVVASLWAVVLSLAVSAVSLVLAVFGAVLCLRDRGSDPDMRLFLGLLALTGALGGAAWLALGLDGWRKKKEDSFLSAVLPVFFCGVCLILFYKTYAQLPALRYTLYPFLGLCAALAALHLIAGFTLGRVRPRLTLFLCGAGSYLCIVALPVYNLGGIW